ncbi:amidohydrolase [Arthrobacter mobilis]|uniref:Amidohydrolase n=1 Tax=Arthrobacter mobilis TaxID=2724944 RepID=A0A7X6HDI2_9MICC|nr:amidohydrolase [Arthrobacter mobilis]NKX55152.1 amidohydrolase [Arthrobacter mobilis]
MADWVFHSGRIFDGVRLHPEATAVAVTDGRITAVGTDAQVRAAAGSAAGTVDLDGRLLSPGFTDAHVHAVYGGVERLGCDLTQVSGADAVLATVREYAAATDREWITGGGWHMADFPGGTPAKELLDAVVPDRPVYLINRDHHGAWVNSRALELAGIDARTPDPADGRLERDGRGNPAGTLHEGAMDLVGRFVPEPTEEELIEGLLEAQRYLHAQGVTGWQEAILGDYAGYPDASRIYRRLAGEGLLTGRATGALWVPRGTTADNLGELVAGFEERRRENAAAGFSTTSAKIMVDGVAENQTAAMLEPYLRPCSCAETTGHAAAEETRGLTYLPREVLLAAAAALDAAGFDLHLHVIGDRAVRNGLDAVEHARKINGCSAGRHHMAHIQVVHPQDVPRFAALGVTANAQAFWACNDDQMTELTLPILGPERAGWQYPFNSLVSAGTALAMGSDWPVSTPDPWQAIHVAVNRRAPGSPEAAPLVPAEALPLQTALAAYTSGSARLNRLDDGGRVRVGGLADLVVLDSNPFELAPEDLHTVRADLTMVGGQAVHVRDRQGAPA